MAFCESAFDVLTIRGLGKLATKKSTGGGIPFQGCAPPSIALSVSPAIGSQEYKSTSVETRTW